MCSEVYGSVGKGVVRTKESVDSVIKPYDEREALDRCEMGVEKK